MANHLPEIARLFFRLGWTAFGGPAAHTAMMEDEIVERRKWMDRQHFLDLMGATNLIPGPNSTELALHCGLHRGGWKGLVVAGLCFLFPAILLTGTLAWLYVEYGTLPEIAPFFVGIKPAVLALILGAVYKLGKKALKGWELGVIGASVVVVALLGVNEILAILGGGFVGMIWLLLMRGGKGKSAMWSWMPLWLTSGLSSGLNLQTRVPVELLAVSMPNPGGIFLMFLKIGAILFGSGYVLVAYLEGDFVGSGLLTQQELLDAVAMGQFTPGPVLSTATFVGFQLDGIAGAAAATAGIFLPSFVFVLLLNPLVPRLRKSPWASAFLDAVNISAVGIMVAVLYSLGEGSLIDWRSWVIAGLSCAVYFGLKKVSSLWIVLGGALLGYLLYLI
ncbi:MAG: chromate efflux transporter [Bacteroidota bacterium]